MVRLSELKTDENLENEGVWVTLPSKIRLKIGRSGSEAWKREYGKIHRERARGFRQGKVPDDLLEEIVLEAMARTILLGWENIEDDNGLPIPYSVENARKLLSVREIRDDVTALSQENDLFRAEQIEDIAGN